MSAVKLTPSLFMGLRLTSNALMPTGKQALVKDKEIVWLGTLGAPIEDADCDEIILSPADYQRFAALSEGGE